MRYTQKWGRPLLQTNHKFNELHPALGSPPPLPGLQDLADSS